MPETITHRFRAPIRYTNQIKILHHDNGPINFRSSLKVRKARAHAWVANSTLTPTIKTVIIPLDLCFIAFAVVILYFHRTAPRMCVKIVCGNNFVIPPHLPLRYDTIKYSISTLPVFDFAHSPAAISINIHYFQFVKFITQFCHLDINIH